MEVDGVPVADDGMLWPIHPLNCCLGIASSRQAFDEGLADHCFASVMREAQLNDCLPCVHSCLKVHSNV